MSGFLGVHFGHFCDILLSLSILSSLLSLSVCSNTHCKKQQQHGFEECWGHLDNNNMTLKNVEDTWTTTTWLWRMLRTFGQQQHDFEECWGHWDNNNMALKNVEDSWTTTTWLWRMLRTLGTWTMVSMWEMSLVLWETVSKLLYVLLSIIYHLHQYSFKLSIQSTVKTWLDKCT